MGIINKLSYQTTFVVSSLQVVSARSSYEFLNEVRKALLIDPCVILPCRTDVTKEKEVTRTEIK
jgi:hypothetical protein